MRRLKLYSVSIAMLIIGSLNAQIQVELKAGLQSSSASVNGISDNVLPTIDKVTRPSLEVNTAYKLDKHFSVGTGLAVEQRGFDVHEGTAFNLAGIDIPLGVELRYRESVVSVPVYLQYTLPLPGVELYAKAGGSANIGTGGNYKTVANTLIDITISDTPIVYDGRIQKTSYSGELGLGVGIPYGSGKFLIEGEYSKAFTNKIEDSVFDLNLREGSIGAKVGYAMAF
jgi:hypothetical protein